ncbi:MAG: hypothetical protein KGI70_01925 [Patescibacteria group bacterium]|nr:hypothetical protein [Patescibacteria group bacterium]
MWQYLLGSMVLAPLFLALGTATASAAVKTPFAAPLPAAALDHQHMTYMRANPTLSGTASNLRAPLQLLLTDTSGAEVYRSIAATTSGSWHATVFPSLSLGNYAVTLVSGTTTLSQGSIVVGASLPRLALDYSLGAFDVADGQLMRFSVRGGSTGAAIGQLTFALNTNAASVDLVTLYGFTDLLYTQAIATGTDASLGSTSTSTSSPLVVIVPASPIEIPPNTTYYFELTGAVTPSDVSYSITTTLLTDGWQDTGAPFAQVASSSNFVWSPNNFGTSTPQDADWFNGSILGDLFPVGLSMERYSTPVVGCNMSASTSTIGAPTPVTVTWQSSGVQSATWSDGTPAALQGSAVFVASTTKTFLLNFAGASGSIQCFTTVVFAASAQQNPGPGSAPPPSPPLGTLSITPASGVAPLSVTARGTVNNNNSCAASTYTLGYGDLSTTTVAVGKNVCKSQPFVLSHRYGIAGTYTAKLYFGAFGSGTTTPQLLASQQIVVTKAVAVNSSSLLAGAAAAIVGIWSVVVQAFRWLFNLL